MTMPPRSCFSFSILIVLLSVSASVTALPTYTDERQSTDVSAAQVLASVCSEVKCHKGSAEWDSTTGLCVCPRWADENAANPCAHLQCPETTKVHFSSATNQCSCKVEHVTPVLIHQATAEIAQQSATIYSVRPYFLEGVISFNVQLAGSPGGFNLNASTTIPADGLGTDPEPNLVLTPENIKSQAPKTVRESATIIAILFNSDETITYHVQLKDGRMTKLSGDKQVHHIDLIDPTAPPRLSFRTSYDLLHQRRDWLDDSEQADALIQSAPITEGNGGMESTSLYTATFSDESCQSIRCLNNGGQAAMFNPFLNACQCQTPLSPELSAVNRVEQPRAEAEQALARRWMEDSLSLPGSGLSGPSASSCRYVIKCEGKSEIYFDKIMRQCVCVIYRPGLKDPIVTSDARPLSSKDQIANLQARDDLSDSKAEILPVGVPPISPMSAQRTCWGDFTDKSCYGTMIGRWDPVRQQCVCVRFLDIDPFE